MGGMRVAGGVVTLVLIAATALATPTRITVRVRSKDGKFLGTSLGGALVTVRNADSGELLARGVTSGTTGNTETLMKKPARRGVPLSDAESARFDATIDIAEPTRLEIAAFGPLAQRQSAGRVAVTQWVVPGKHLTGGDGVLLELPGLSVRLLAPPPHRRVETLPAPVEIRANVIMMCGCPVTPGGLWDAARLEVKALVKRDGRPQGEVTLAYAGEASLFSARLELREAGVYEITVYAYDPSNGNTGVDTTTVVVGD